MSTAFDNKFVAISIAIVIIYIIIFTILIYNRSDFDLALIILTVFIISAIIALINDDSSIFYGAASFNLNIIAIFTGIFLAGFLVFGLTALVLNKNFYN